MKKAIVWIFAVWALFALLWYLTVAFGDYTVDLPNGYMLGSPYPDNVSIHPRKQDFGIAKPHVPPRISQLGDYNGIVYGYVELSPNLNDREPGTVGYFVLNTRTHSVRVGLDEVDWLKALSDNGIMQKPTMVSPSPFYRCQSDRAVRDARSSIPMSNDVNTR